MALINVPQEEFARSLCVVMATDVVAALLSKPRREELCMILSMRFGMKVCRRLDKQGWLPSAKLVSDDFQLD